MKLLSATIALAAVFSSSLAAQDGQTTVDEGPSAFFKSFGFHDPMYFLYGPEPIHNAKFQFSFRYNLFDLGASTRPSDVFPGRGLFAAYTQLTFWDLESASAPFFDTSYKPSIFFRYEDVVGRGQSWVHRFHVETGFLHESNGNEGVDSRSLNMFYVKPIFVWRLFGRSSLLVAPKVWAYFRISENPDIGDFRGNFSLDLTWRFDSGMQFATVTHVGNGLDKGSFEANLTFPMDRLWRPLNFYIFAQFFDGYAETILRYDRNTDSNWRLGVSLSR